jgi:hypothetical protein
MRSATVQSHSCLAIACPKLLLSLTLLFISVFSFAQNGVSVNYQTGAASINIPIHTIQRREISVPISLSYSASGVHVNDVAGSVGMGWTLNAGGAITRQVRDLPDDVKTDNQAVTRTGWIFNGSGALINNFVVANDNNPATCTDEATDLSYIGSHFFTTTDLQPDIFTISVPGLYCSFVYDNVAGQFRTIPYQDLKISYTMNAVNNGIGTFTVTNDQGVTYVFGRAENTTVIANNPGTVWAYSRQFNCYQNGINIADAWYLTSIMDPGANNIVLNYTAGIPYLTSSPITSIFGSGSNSWTTTPQYTIQTVVNPLLVAGVAVLNSDNTIYEVDSVHMTYGRSYNGYYDEVQTIKCASGQSYTFGYGHTGTNTVRDYLTSFGEPNCDNTSIYNFAYSGVNFSANTTTLPDSANYGQDYWGYSNGNTAATNLTPQLYVFPDNPSYPNLERYRYYAVPGYTGTYFVLPGTDRSANGSYITAGTLNQMTTPLGGTVSFTYEPNDYYDVSAATTHIGGGIRIKQLVFADGINAAGNVTKNYTYTDPSTGVSTGEPISLPQFAFTTPNSGDPGTATFWNTTTVRNALNLSPESTTILYGKVKEQQSGSGSSLYQFINPGTFWQTSASPDWSPTVTDVASPTINQVCPIGSAKNSTYGYPFPSNVNYNFERGLLSTVTRYNDAGTQVGQTVYTYQRSYSTPAKIPGFAYETYGVATYYSKYFLELATSELTSTATNYVNDIGNTTNDATRQQKSVTNYYYQSPNHKLVTKIESVNTDGTTNRQYIQYAKDYAVASAVDAPSLALKGLVSLNQNLPVEKYWTVTKSGTELAVAAELYSFALISPRIPLYLYMPNHKYNFVSGAGVSNFAFSSISGAGVFQSYPNYKTATNFTQYHPNGVLMVSDDNFHNVKSELIEDDLLQPIATFTNATFTDASFNYMPAAYNEAGYCGFETTGYEYNWAITSPGTATSTPRSGLYCEGMSTSTVISESFNLRANVNHYIFSGWVNAATAGSLTIQLLNSSGTQFSSTPLSFASTATNQWQYYEVRIPTAGLTTQFKINIQSSVANNVDDLLFYPETSEVTTAARDIYKGVLTSKTNTNGVAEYYSYDNLNRLQFVYDQDKNITLKRTYANVNAMSTYSSATFNYAPTAISGNAAVTFTGPTNMACVPGTFYAWNFGDGKATTPTLNAYQAVHSYAAAGTYTVTLNTTNAVFGNKQTSQNVTVAAGPELGVAICQSGVNAFNQSANTFTTTTCIGHPTSNTISYFWVTGISNPPPGAVITYQWQIRYADGGAGSAAFANISGATANNYSVPFTMSTARPFQMQVVVTDTNSGQSATSNILFLSLSGPQ